MFVNYISFKVHLAMKFKTCSVTQIDDNRLLNSFGYQPFWKFISPITTLVAFTGVTNALGRPTRPKAGQGKARGKARR